MDNNPPPQQNPQQPTQQPPPQPPQPEPKKSKLMMIIIAVVVLVLLTAAAVAGYFIVMNNNPETNTEKETTQNVSPTPLENSNDNNSQQNNQIQGYQLSLEKKIDDSNLKTFSIEENDISFQYPSNWGMEEREITNRTSEPHPLEDDTPLLFYRFGTYENIDHIGEEVEPYLHTKIIFLKYENINPEILSESNLLTTYGLITTERDINTLERNGVTFRTVHHMGNAAGSMFVVFVISDNVVYEFSVTDTYGNAYEVVNTMLATLSTPEFSFEE